MTKSNWAERKQELQRKICSCNPIALQDNKHFLNCPNFELELLLQSEINKAYEKGWADKGKQMIRDMNNLMKDL